MMSTWSAASNNAVHQILNFVSGEDYIDLRYLGIEAPDESGQILLSIKMVVIPICISKTMTMVVILKYLLNS